MPLLLRTLSLPIRITQFLTALIVLALTSTFLHQPTKFNTNDRLIYTLVIAVLSLILSLLFLLPTTHTIVHTGVDLLMAAAWFAVFGVLTSWKEGGGLGMVCELDKGAVAWEWERLKFWESSCAQWQAAQAFAFIAAVVWFAGFVLGLLGWAKRERHATQVVAADGGETAVVPATARTGWRRWLPKSKA